MDREKVRPCNRFLEILGLYDIAFARRKLRIKQKKDKWDIMKEKIAILKEVTGKLKTKTRNLLRRIIVGKKKYLTRKQLQNNLVIILSILNLQSFL